MFQRWFEVSPGISLRRPQPARPATALNDRGIRTSQSGYGIQRRTWCVRAL